MQGAVGDLRDSAEVTGSPHHDEGQCPRDPVNSNHLRSLQKVLFPRRRSSVDSLRIEARSCFAKRELFIADVRYSAV